MGEHLKKYTRGEFTLTTKQESLPSNMLIELTNACNHACIFCAHEKMKRKVGMIDPEFCLRIMKEAYEGGTREVGFYMTGEPLLCNQLVDYVKYAKELGYEYVYITTNGALANMDRMKPIVDAGLDSIKFSINAGTRETYKLVHGRDDFDAVIENLKTLSTYAKEAGKALKMFVTCILCKQNEKEFTVLKEMIQDYVQDVVGVPAYNQGGNVYEIKENIMLDPDYKLMKTPCIMLFNRLHITYEGYLNACCVDFENMLKVADLNQTSLLEAWNSAPLQKLREMHLSGELAENCMCYNCVYNENHPVKSIEEIVG